LSQCCAGLSAIESAAIGTGQQFCFGFIINNTQIVAHIIYQLPIAFLFILLFATGRKNYPHQAYKKQQSFHKGKNYFLFFCIRVAGCNYTAFKQSIITVSKKFHLPVIDKNAMCAYWEQATFSFHCKAVPFLHALIYQLPIPGSSRESSWVSPAGPFLWGQNLQLANKVIR